MRPARRAATAAGLALAVLAVLAGPTSAAFLARTTNASSWAAAASFPDYPTQVLRSTPVSYFRTESDAPTAAAPSQAHDSATGTNHGVYAAATDGPSTWWRLDEASGVTTAADSSGAANLGARVGGATSVEGRHGTAAHLDGVDDRIVGARPSVRTDLAWTAALWVRLEHRDHDQWALAQDGVTQSAFALGYRKDVDRWGIRVTGSDTTDAASTLVGGSTSPTPAVWTHLTATYAGGTLRLYVDGVLEASAPHSPAWIATGPLAVGRVLVNGAGVARWTGGVDDVRTYRRALPASEVASLHGRTPGTGEAGMTTGLRGALLGPQKNLDGGFAVAFAGTSNAYSPATFTNPSTFSLELWFRVAGTQGGHLIGLASTQTGLTGFSDRMVFVDSGGRLSFVTKGAARLHVVRSPGAVNDGQWHHLVATMSPATGMRLYLDGALVDQLATFDNADSYTGYWRAGGARVDGWPNNPPAQHLLGTLDEIAVYTRVLSAAEVSGHYAANY